MTPDHFIDHLTDILAAEFQHDYGRPLTDDERAIVRRGVERLPRPNPANPMLWDDLPEGPHKERIRAVMRSIYEELRSFQ